MNLYFGCWKFTRYAALMPVLEDAGLLYQDFVNYRFCLALRSLGAVGEAGRRYILF